MNRFFLFSLLAIFSVQNSYAGLGLSRPQAPQEDLAVTAEMPAPTENSSCPQTGTPDEKELNTAIAAVADQVDEAQKILQDESLPIEIRKKAFIGACMYIAGQVLSSYEVPGASHVVAQFNSIAIADVLTGMFHWMEDTYFTEQTPLIGQIITDNRLHHAQPQAILRHSAWKRIETPTIAAALVFAGLTQVLDSSNYYYAASILGWSAVANQIHAYTHMRFSERPWLVQMAQGYIFQSKEEHMVHHMNTDRNYCVVTPWLNGVLNTLKFWRGLEWMIEKVTGVPPRLHEKPKAA